MPYLSRLGLALIAATTALFTLAGTASAQSSYRFANSDITTRCASTTKTVDADWYFPGGEARGLIWLQHGFGRSNDAVHELGTRFAEDGYVVFAPTVGSLDLLCGFNNTNRYVTYFDDLLARLDDGSFGLLKSARAAGAKIGLRVRALPADFAFVGHSAGGAALTYVADDLHEYPSAYAHLKGVLLLDSVETISKTMQRSLPGIVRERPVLTIAGPGGICNSGASGTTALLNAAAGFTGVRLVNGHHTDAEGGSTDLVGTTLCGKPSAVDVQTLQDLARGWIDDWFSGSRTAAFYPGGSYLEQRAAEGVLVPLQAG